ncbi:MAG TPA: alpha/beta fold hydrolase [Steroidobacteraceae bacterium]|nr:alpha/beta fold hydrolase [Steroidobacteraceae bacterium]
MLRHRITVIAARHDAPTLVLLPGWGFSSAVFSPLIEHLRDRSIMTLDLPGYGEERGTPAPRKKSGPRKRANKVLAERAAGPGFVARRWRDVILSQLPPVCDLMGWSLGGQVAMEIAATNPGRVRRLVLVATTPCFVRRRGWNAGTPRAMFDEFNWRLAQDPIATLKNFLSRVARGDANERSVLRKLRVAASRAAAPDVLALRAGLDLLRDMDLRKQVPAIRVPTLVIHGTRDRVVPPAAGRWIARHIASAKFAALPDAAHAPFLSDTATFIAAMTRFLAAA